MADHVRRAVVVVLTAFALLVAPQIAHAAFTARTAPALAVSTASLTEPADVALDLRCSYSGFLGLNRGAQATVNGFDGNDLPGATFAYTLSRGNTTVDSETTTSRSAYLSTGGVFTFNSVTYRVTIQPRVQGWTGPTFTRTITC